MSKPQQIADMIRDAVAGLPPPQNAAEAYEQLQDLAYLAEAVQATLGNWGETLAGLGSLKPAYPAAMHEAAGELATVADGLRELQPPPRPREDGEEDEDDGRPDWVQPYRYSPGHIREEHPPPPLPGMVRPPGRRGPPPDTHEVFVPSYYSGRRPPAAMSPREARKRARRARKNATPREGAGEWLAKWGQILHNKL